MDELLDLGCSCEFGCLQCDLPLAAMGNCPGWNACPIGREPDPDCRLSKRRVRMDLSDGGCFLSKAEYRSALRAEHGTLRRFLAGCRCPLCDRPSHHRFAKSDALASRASVQHTSGMERLPTGDLRRLEVERSRSAARTSPGHSAGVGIG